MTLPVQLAPEQFKPIPLRLNASWPSRVAFSLRRLVDLQLDTICTFLKPRLGGLRGTLLDVGCGEMPYRSWLPEDGTYTGIDVPQARAFGMRGEGNVVPFDGRSIPFPGGTFDSVLCTEVLEHAADPAALIAEMHRVLMPGGTLIATTPFAARVHYAPYDFHRFTRYALEAQFGAFGHVAIGERGNDIAVIANKLTVLAVRLLRPGKWSILAWPLLLALVPIAVGFLLAAHVSMALGLGSTDDPLGYAIVAVK